MKKGILLSLLVLALVVVTGCGSSKEETKVLTCTMSGTVVEGTTIDSTYKVTYTGDYVDLVESTETVTSDTEEILDAYKETVESMYSAYDDVKYYDYNVSLDGDTLTSTAKINYAKIDADAMIEVNSANSSLFTDGKVTLTAIETLYKAMGATCE